MRLLYFVASRGAGLLILPVVLLILSGCNSGPSDAAGRAQAEQEVASLREANQELQKLRADNQELPRLRRDNEEMRRLREQSQDLDRLRQENSKLRGQLQALKPAKGPGLMQR